MGDLDQAMAHYESAMALCRKAGYKPELAWSCFDYAATLLERNDAGDRARAVAPLEESISISSELLMRPLADRLVALQEKMESTPLRGPAYPDGLTQRELDVIRLVAAGRTDREIAGELVISVRTVTTHVGNILNKTGAANRAEAASYATRHGLE
ncbi:MAG: response regulator transcription factor [Chloroflexi bacterium]|nr:response regulator transcription factor [Chloroflexota bacterium]